MKNFIEGIDKPQQIKVSKKSTKKIIVEFYSNNQSHTPGYWAEILLTKNCLKHNSLLDEHHISLKELAINEWGYIDAYKNLYFGNVYLSSRQKTNAKKYALDNSYFIFNNNTGDIKIVLWADKLFELNVSSRKKYNSGYIEYKKEIQYYQIDNIITLKQHTN